MRTLVRLLGLVLIFQGAGAVISRLLLLPTGGLFVVSRLPVLAGHRAAVSVGVAVLGAVLLIAPSGRPWPRDGGEGDGKGARTALRRAGPVLGLALLAPLVGEYLLGNVPITDLFALPILALMYGGGAVVVRETARRTGRGWPTILLLALAYGVIEPGLFDHSLFNPDFEGLDARHGGSYLPALGFSAANAVSYAVGHAVWSIGVPIALVETLVPGRRTTPWLSRTGLALAAGTYLLGGLIVMRWSVRTEDFVPSVPQLLGAAAVAAALVGLAFAAGRRGTGGHGTGGHGTGGDGTGGRPRPRPARGAPRPWVTGVAAFLAASVFCGRDETWGHVAAGVAVLAVTAVVIGRWSRRTGWGAPHRLALAGGALLTYGWIGFTLHVLKGTASPVNLAGQAGLVLGALVLLAVAARVAARAGGSGSGDPPGGATAGAASADPAPRTG